MTITLVISSLLALEEILHQQYLHFTDVIVEFVTDLFVYFIVSLLLGLFTQQIIHWLNQKYPWENQLSKRLSIEVGILVSLVGLFSAGQSYIIYKLAPVEGLSVKYEVVKYEVMAVLMYFIGLSMLFAYHEYVIFKKQKKYVANVADKLKKQNLLIKYDALKHQIDPHFLFNGLNVLAALMKKDTPLAEQFIQRLSEVYRYVLELNKVEFVTLNEELDFIDSYLFMQKLRYNDTILVSKSVKNSDLNKLVPPMALQVIVENALKHNEISAVKPLQIRINSSDGYVVVSNSYNPKETPNTSTGLGQKNIIERYQLIDSKLPQFYVEEQKYVAKLPLIQSAKPVIPQTAAISNVWAFT